MASAHIPDWIVGITPGQPAQVPASTTAVENLELPGDNSLPEHHEHHDRYSHRSISHFPRSEMSGRFSFQVDRLVKADVPVGVTAAFRRPVPTESGKKAAGTKPITQRRLDLENRRPELVREMLAEATGLFICLYPGMASTASLMVNNQSPIAGSLLQTGLAYGVSIPLAIITCASTSGGHFNPAFTLCFAIFSDFPWWKAPFYIFSQILGAFLASLFVMVQYHQEISNWETRLVTTQHRGDFVYAGGPASILVPLPATSAHLGYLFMTEWFAATFVALVAWAALDPSNPFIRQMAAPFVIGLAYASMIWGFASATLSLNLARDVGARLVAMIFFYDGKAPFSYGHYPWISTLVSLPATLLAVGYYELVMRDSILVIGQGNAVHEDGEEGFEAHLRKVGKKIVEGQLIKDDKDMV